MSECPEEKPEPPPVCEKVKKKGKPEKPSPPKPGGYSSPVLEFPHFLRIIGPKHIKILMQFVPSAIIYGVTSFMFLTYAAEWKAVLQYLPYYNGKYADDESTKPKDEEAEN